MALYTDQEQLLADARASMLQGHRRVLCVLPTGGGKTHCFIEAARRTIERGKRALVLVHRRELLHQTNVRLMKSGITPGVNRGVFVSTIGKRTHFRPDLLIVDEAHHCVSPTWARKIDEYDVPLLGWTATPERLDGRGLGEVFDDMVIGPSVSELMEQNRLSRYRLFHPPPDFDPGSERAVFSAVRNWKAFADGRRTIAFCISIEHAAQTCAAFKAAGVPAEVLDSKLTDTERLERIARFKNGETLMLVSVMLISEGFDVPDCDCVLLLRPTSSLSLYLQQVGRGLRFSGEPCVILDCVGNSQHPNLGLPDDFHHWSLEGKKVRAGQDGAAPPLKVCPGCFQVHRPGPPRCPFCGFVYPVAKIVPREVDAILTESVAQPIQVVPKRELIRNARTEEDLRRLAQENGYKPGWVDRILAARNARR
jgi:superfamily II DNA or RNA helicase